jgi:hypothetical protein
MGLFRGRSGGFWLNFATLGVTRRPLARVEGGGSRSPLRKTLNSAELRVEGAKVVF